MTPLTPPREPRRESTPVGPSSLAWMREHCRPFREMQDRALAAGLIKEDKGDD
jgi:hypothetical protein